MTYPLPMGRKFPVITVDLTKCTVPFLCKKCLQVCPSAVFHVTRVMQKEKRLEEMDPRVDGNYVLYGSRRDKCTSCNLCIEVCPVNAIKLGANYETVHYERKDFLLTKDKLLAGKG